jgi:hypothetical protein
MVLTSVIPLSFLYFVASSLNCFKENLVKFLIKELLNLAMVPLYPSDINVIIVLTIGLGADWQPNGNQYQPVGLVGYGLSTQW